MEVWIKRKTQDAIQSDIGHRTKKKMKEAPSKKTSKRVRFDEVPSRQEAISLGQQHQ